MVTEFVTVAKRKRLQKSYAEPLESFGGDMFGSLIEGTVSLNIHTAISSKVQYFLK
jgi:hypothetical protein